MNVLILPAGGAHARRNLESKFQTLLSDAGDSNPRLVREPPRQVVAVRERYRSVLADTVESYQGVVHVFIRCIGEEAQPMADLAPADMLARRRTFWGEDAWRNLAVWIRKHPGAEAPSWRADVRTNLNWAVRDARHGHAASLIDVASPEWAEYHKVQVDDAEEQRRLQAQVADIIGSLHGGDPNRAEQASARVRDVIARKYGR